MFGETYIMLNLLIFLIVNLVLNQAKVIWPKTPVVNSVPLCSNGYKEIRCLRWSTKNMTWNEGFTHCRNQNGFLINPDVDGFPIDTNFNFAWTALTFVGSHPQWLSKIPAYGAFLRWKGSHIPHETKRNCIKYEVIDRTFSLEDCDTKLLVACVLESTEIGGDAKQDLELKYNFNTKPNYIEVDSNTFQSVVLSCHAHSLSSNKELELTTSFWMKDGIWLGHKGRFLQPATVADLSKQFGDPYNHTSSDFMYQGSYCCGQWLYKRTDIIHSNCITILHSEWTTLTFSVYTKNDIRQSVSDYLKLTFPEYIFPVEMPAISVSFVVQVSDYEYKYETKFNLYANRSNFMCSYFMINAMQTVIEKKNVRNKVRMVGCFTKYHIPPITDASNKCATSARDFCETYFTTGELCYPTPTLCPKHYNSQTIDGACTKISEKQQWDSTFSSLEYNPSRISMLKSLRNKHSSYQKLRDQFLQKKIDSVWLPFRRIRKGGPILAFINEDKEILENSFEKWPSFVLFRWDENEPSFEGMCRALNVTTNRTSMVNCKKFLHSVDILPPVKIDILRKPVLIQSTNKCLSGWFLTRLDSCIRFFLKPVSKGEEAELFCRDQNAQLVTVYDELSNFNLHDILKYKKINQTWAQITDSKQYNDCFSDQTRDWSNFKSTFVLVSREGWRMHGNSDVITCERGSSNIQPSLKIDIKKNTLTLKHFSMGRINRTNLQCYRNGFPIFQSKNKSLTTAKLTEHGYYECIDYATTVMGTRTETLYYRHPEIYTIAILASTTYQYVPFRDDSTKVKKDKLLNHPCLDSIRKFLRNGSVNKIFRKSYVKVTLQYYFPKNGNLGIVINVEVPKNKAYGYNDILGIMETTLQKTSFAPCSIDEVRSTSGCPRISFITKSNISLHWSNTISSGNFPPDELCVQKNGELVVRKCIGDFVVGFSWERFNSDCYRKTKNETVALWHMANDPIGYMKGELGEMSKLITNTTISEADIYYAASTLLKVCDNIKSNQTIEREEVVNALDSLLTTEKDKLYSCQERLNTSSSLVHSVEDILLQTSSNTNSPSFIKGSQVIIQCVDFPTNSTVGFEVDTKRNSKMINRGEKASLDKLDTAIVLPNNLVDDRKLLFMVYDNDKLFYDNDTLSKGKMINQKIISATYGDVLVHDLPLDEAIEIFFRVTMNSPMLECVFWDFMKNNRLGGWSSRGCFLHAIESGIAICKCNHLTSFALLITYSEKNTDTTAIANGFTLKTISLIGCCLSILGLGLVILTFLLFKQWRKPLSNKILANLAFAIMCSMIIFLLGIEQTQNIVLCRLVAISLHYFILASFCWMVVESVHQYLRFVKVVGIYIPGFLRKASLSAWGLPIIPVTVVSIYDINIYGGYINNDHKMCWMSFAGFFYAFLPPLGIAMFLNLLCFAIILKSTLFTKTKLKSTMSKRDLLKNQLTMAMFVFFLLGLTWTFGFFSLLQMNIVFSYLFSIFNTLQGFVIFLFHFSRDRQVKHLWVNWVYNVSRTNSFASRSSSRSTKWSSLYDRSRLSTKSSSSSGYNRSSSKSLKRMRNKTQHNKSVELWL